MSIVKMPVESERPGSWLYLLCAFLALVIAFESAFIMMPTPPQWPPPMSWDLNGYYVRQLDHCRTELGKANARMIEAEAFKSAVLSLVNSSTV